MPQMRLMVRAGVAAVLLAGPARAEDPYGDALHGSAWAFTTAPAGLGQPSAPAAPGAPATAVAPAAAVAPPPQADAWWRGLNVAVGAGVGLSPTYEGSGSYHVRALPLISLNYRDVVFVGAGGIGVNLYRGSGFRVAVTGGYDGGRKQSDDAHLNGLGDIKGSVVGGATVSYRIRQFSLRASLRQAVTNRSNGLTGTLGAQYALRLGEQVTLRAGPELTLADGDNMRSHFGVDLAQSRASGLPTFNAGAGAKDVGFGSTLSYRFADDWSLVGFARVKELLGDAGASPITQSRQQGFVGLGVTYHLFGGAAAHGPEVNPDLGDAYTSE